MKYLYKPAQPASVLNVGGTIVRCGELIDLDDATAARLLAKEVPCIFAVAESGALAEPPAPPALPLPVDPAVRKAGRKARKEAAGKAPGDVPPEGDEAPPEGEG